jgi:hypothetical protein
MVKLPRTPDAEIDSWLSCNDAALMGYPVQLEGHSLPIHLALTQTLPNFGLGDDLGNISICLIDYSEGKTDRSVHYSQSLSSTSFE